MKTTANDLGRRGIYRNYNFDSREHFFAWLYTEANKSSNKYWRNLVMILSDTHTICLGMDNPRSQPFIVPTFYLPEGMADTLNKNWSRRGKYRSYQSRLAFSGLEKLVKKLWKEEYQAVVKELKKEQTK